VVGLDLDGVQSADHVADMALALAGGHERGLDDGPGPDGLAVERMTVRE
jgi:hypothetical protein